MQVVPYLTFSGNCEAAFRFYEQTLGGRIVSLMTHGNSPMAAQVSPDWKDKVMHAVLDLGGSLIMGSDAPAKMFQKAQGMSLSVGFGAAQESERIFNALADGGTVTMPFSKTFWSAGFGMVTDRFGTPWMVNTDQPA